MAYKRSGGAIELPKDLREKTADTLSKMEQALRKVEEKSEQGKGESRGNRKDSRPLFPG